MPRDDDDTERLLCRKNAGKRGEEQSRRGSDTLTGAEEVPGLWVEKPQTRIMRARLERRETSSRLEAWLMSEP